MKVEGVEPMTSVTLMRVKLGKDGVTDGGQPERVLANAPQCLRSSKKWPHIQFMRERPDAVGDQRSQR